MLSTRFFCQLMSKWKEVFASDIGIGNLQVQPNWVDIVNGKGTDDLSCRPWWEIDTVSTKLI